MYGNTYTNSYFVSILLKNNNKVPLLLRFK
jgi:hypothetical protein